MSALEVMTDEVATETPDEGLKILVPRSKEPVFVAPADDTKIWRYLDFTKFVSLLEAQAIWFPPASSFKDPFEGSVTPEDIRQWRAVWDLKPESVDRLVAQHTGLRHFMRRWQFISCWHMNEHESEAMWKLYARTEEAIAIRSTYASLRACLPNNPSDSERHVNIGVVRYIDYSTATIPDAFGNFYMPLLHKRESFKHECELRAIVSPEIPPDINPFTDADKPSPPGISVPVDLDSLVHEIYVAPTCAPWFKELVEKMLVRYGLAKKVKQSSLDALPNF